MNICHKAKYKNRPTHKHLTTKRLQNNLKLVFFAYNKLC